MIHPSQPSRVTYLNGLLLAAILTAIPFALIWSGLLGGTAAYTVIAVAAVLQIIVHMVFFLHVDFKATPAENLFFLAFAIVLIGMMVGGSIWIMSDLHHRMRY
ncbi:cytochrome o ubiquinol oxidase subunit IV [Roseibium sp. RKSG952]|uniref:cytochrome o ubiquinol oxidase subunit IV n=1 Tax=Roseibium sp. RKSG952 TaxID=2529384 RepID=UPI0012BBFFC3|nr:cytochrome o ubiquinol oxidase subunit IV [Roseibium sp. RKSG952]MTH97664.1 cytochrome o ubiquinol oxidase subunit IV [Roseibium sp. RKSG952]